MRELKLILCSCATVYRRFRTLNIQHIETNFEIFLIRRRIKPEFITFFAKVLEKWLEKTKIQSIIYYLSDNIATLLIEY